MSETADLFQPYIVSQLLRRTDGHVAAWPAMLEAASGVDIVRNRECRIEALRIALGNIALIYLRALIFAVAASSIAFQRATNMRRHVQRWPDPERG